MLLKIILLKNILRDISRIKHVRFNNSFNGFVNENLTKKNENLMCFYIFTSFLYRLFFTFET